MGHEKELAKAQALLHQTLNSALNSMPNNRSVVEAKQHIKIALAKLEHASQKQASKKQTIQSEYQKWWNDVSAGVSKMAAQPMTQETQVSTLKALDDMIANEQSKLADLERQSAKTQQDQSGNDLING